MLLLTMRCNLFSLWDHHQDNNINKNNIHFMHLINIGHAPLFHIIFYTEILFFLSIYIILYKNRGIQTCQCARNTSGINIFCDLSYAITSVACN